MDTVTQQRYGRTFILVIIHLLINFYIPIEPACGDEAENKSLRQEEKGI